MRSLLRLLCSLLLLVSACQVSLAADPGFLTSSANADGTVSTSADSALPFQSTTEALTTFAALGVTGAPVDDALAYLNALPADGTTEFLSRRIAVNSAFGLDTTADLASLVALQNGDGGFGAAAGFESSTLDTAFALEALFAAKPAAGEEASRAIGYLLAAQHATGGWALGGNDDDVGLTARTLKALWNFRHIYAVGKNVELAQTFLVSRRAADGQWGAPDTSALVFSGVIPLYPDLTTLADGLTALQAGQLANLSWVNDVYATALALRAIGVSKIETNPGDPGSIITNPDLGSVTGRVAVAETGEGLSGLTVSLAGIVPSAVQTQADGTFLFTKLPPGGYLVSLAAAGYGSFASPVTVGYGSNVNLGIINLSAVVTPTTATLRGVVTNVSDGKPIQYATVTAGGKTATTGATGAYEITGIAPGMITITATRSGYLSVSATAEAVAGGTVVFSPQMSTTNPGVIKGTVRNAATGVGMAGVTITLSGATVRTITAGSNGVYSITGFNAGPTTIKASAVGYAPVSAEIVADIGGNYDFSPNMIALAQATTSLQVVVSDGSTKTPLSGAGVELSGANNAMAQTDAAGRILFEGLTAGTTMLKIQNTGFLTREGSIVIEDGKVSLVTAELTPEGTVTPTSFANGRVVDAETGSAVPGVVVEATQGDVTVATVADADGRFTLSKIASGAWVVQLHRDNYVAFDSEFFMPSKLPTIALGTLTMHPVAKLPDLVPFFVDRSAIVSNRDTFAMSGTLGITVRNQGLAATQAGFDILVYFDVNRDDLYDAAVDQLIATRRVSELIAPDTNYETEVPISAELPYRDAILSIRVDHRGEVPESIEENNQATTAELAGCGQ